MISKYITSRSKIRDMSKNGNRAIMHMLHKEADSYCFDEWLEIHVIYIAELYRKHSNPGDKTFLQYAKEIYG